MEFRDLKRQYKKNKRSIDKAIKKVLKEGVFIGGKPVQELEEKLAEYVGVKHCITCANGTDALTLVLMAWGIGKGDAVFVPDFTFFATAEAPAFLGATPIFVDVDEHTFNMDPISLEKAIIAVKKEGKLKLKVIIPVDLFGLPADYDAIIPLAKKYNLLVLEDAAQGFGGSIRDQKACSFGDAAITSFFPAKPLGCYGDGGAIFTNDGKLKEVLESLKVHGKGQSKYDNTMIGMNSRLDSIQASILNIKFKSFITIELTKVQTLSDIYTSYLSRYVKTPEIPSDFFSSFAQYSIQLKDETERNEIINYLSENDIPTNIYYPKILSSQLAFKDLKNPIKNSIAEVISKTVISLPFDPYKTSSDIKKIFQTFENYYSSFNDGKNNDI